MKPVVTNKLLAAAFTEWDRRWREEPDAFMSDMEHLSESCESYGDACAIYFEKLLNEV
jgi:hypothetical protein